MAKRSYEEAAASLEVLARELRSSQPTSKELNEQCIGALISRLSYDLESVRTTRALRARCNHKNTTRIKYRGMYAIEYCYTCGTKVSSKLRRI